MITDSAHKPSFLLQRLRSKLTARGWRTPVTTLYEHTYMEMENQHLSALHSRTLASGRNIDMLHRCESRCMVCHLISLANCADANDN